MGRQTTLTLEHMKTAVAALQAEGKNVTSRAVREKLGNVGSMGTVNKLLHQALTEQEEKPQSLRQLPPELQRTFLSFVDQQAEEARRQIAEELMHCRGEMAELAEDNELVSMTVESLRQELSESMSRTASVQGQVKQLASDLATAREETVVERGKAEALRIELIKLQLRADASATLEDELRLSRIQCDTQRTVCMKLEQSIAVLQEQKNSLEQQHTNLQAETSNAHVMCLKLTEKVDAISLLLDKEREARMLAERDLAVASATFAKRRPLGNRTSNNKERT